MTIAKTFFYALAAGFAIIVTWTLISGVSEVTSMPADTRPPAVAVAHPAGLGQVLRDQVFVRSQVTAADVPVIASSGFRTLIALRPDGEEAGQPTSQEIGAAARAAGMTFAYIPTPHGDIPASVPDTLAKDLATAPRPVLLYCRSGKRAARVWALAEASRTGGATAEDISAAVRGAGQTVDDLQQAIQERMAARSAMMPAVR